MLAAYAPNSYIVVGALVFMMIGASLRRMRLRAAAQRKQEEERNSR